MDTKQIDGALFANMLRGGAAALYDHRQAVNDLNVFPIPDGDTGDNMFMTMDSGVAALNSSQTDTITAAASAAAKGMLMGARGNSGVILSRIFAGIAKGLEGANTADVDLLNKAMQKGVYESYSAVSVPVEGTILTVFKDAAAYAGSAIQKETTAERYFDDLLTEMKRSLQRTPELLDVLQQSGVVDSGGAGLTYIMQGMQDVLNGKNAAFSIRCTADISKAIDINAADEDSLSEFGYCTEFLLRLLQKKTDAAHFDITEMLRYLNTVGESVVAFQEGSILKVHVHTKKPGDILNYAQQYGEFLTTKIENMTLQHHETLRSSHTELPQTEPRKSYGIISVASGSGIKELFLSLGCDAVVDGGQSMNPSANELIETFRKVNADTLLVYPNNANIILTAKQAKELYHDAEVCILPTKTIGEAYAAISMLDTDKSSVQDILNEQTEIISGVVTGIVSRAVRDSTQNELTIHKGNYIGFSEDRIMLEHENKNDALLALAEQLHSGSFDIALVICGESVTMQDSDTVYDALKKQFPVTEIIMIDGKQPIYDYILTLE